MIIYINLKTNYNYILETIDLEIVQSAEKYPANILPNNLDFRGDICG